LDPNERMPAERAGLQPAVPSGAEEGNAAGEDKAKPHQRLLRSKGFIPIVVVIALVVFVLLSPRIAGSPPRLDSITPSRGKQGDVMILTGRNFGPTRGTSEVRIAGASPTSSDYGEWTDTRISVTIPDEAASGIVYVLTKSGRSRGVLFVSQTEIPVLASGGARPGDPYIGNGSDRPINPAAAPVGAAITIYGMNFGLEKGSSEVYFSPSAGGESDASSSLDVSNLLPAQSYNLDYISWSDREITLRVPDGAGSGNVLVATDKGTSNFQYFDVSKGAGRTLYTAARKYSVQYAMDVRVTAASGENALYLWMPRIVPSPEQRRIQLVEQSPEPLLVNSGPALYEFTGLQKNGSYRASMSWMFDRYAVSTQVTTAEIPGYDTASELYRHFTEPDGLAPSASPEIQKAAAAAVGGEKNPWLKARRLYDWLLGQLSYAAAPAAPAAPAGTAAGTAAAAAPAAVGPLAALRLKRGDAFAFSSLYCALLRAASVPARMVAGYLVAESNQPTRRHFWNELYLPTVGWVPVDPTLGKERSLLPSTPAEDFDNRAFYFGNLDNRHITLSKGLEEVNQMNPTGKTRQRAELPWLLTVHEESAGALGAYTTTFEDLSVTGTYIRSILR
jgi:hypothetical protein